MNAVANRLLDYAEDVLSSCELLADCSWGHHMSTVLHLRDATGATWYVKSHRDRERYFAELTAYRCWVSALQDRAPRLRASNDSLRVIILSALPGQQAGWPSSHASRPTDASAAEQAMHREAGAVLRRLHNAQSGHPWPAFAAAKMAEFQRLMPTAASLLTSDKLDRARAQIAALAGLPAPERVPCHHDYTPRNWLIQDRTLYVIDFEWSGHDAWVADLARMYLGIWPGRPDLQEAFLGGYRRYLSTTDRKMLHGCAVLTAVWLVVRAHESRQASFEDASRAALLRIIDESA